MFDFGKFNKKQIFTAELTGEEDYCNLEYLVKRDGLGGVYTVKAFYLSTKSKYDSEVPLALIDDYYVNLPQHQLGEVKEILSNDAAIKAINEGKAAFTIESYEQKRYGKTCYKAVWCNAD